MQRLEITRPDDWHLHLRDGETLRRVLPWTTRVFRRAIVMPNLVPPVETTADAHAYRERILAARPTGSDFDPLMTLYLTEHTTPAEIRRAADSEWVHAVKLYPKGATTHSDAGIDGVRGLAPVLDALERHDVPLLVHGESIRPDCDVFDRERVFLEETFAPLVERHPGLRVVFEHITTAEAAAFVSEAPGTVAATITPQHLLLDRNALFDGGLRPHHFCLPVLKRERDRRALVAAAISGSPRFFLGTDSAPHGREAKECDAGCAGIFSAPIAIELYAEVFAAAGVLDRLEGFASHYGADFHRLPRNPGRLRLESVGEGVETAATAARPEWIGDGPDAIRVFWAGRSLRYRAAESV